MCVHSAVLKHLSCQERFLTYGDFSSLCGLWFGHLLPEPLPGMVPGHKFRQRRTCDPDSCHTLRECGIPPHEDNHRTQRRLRRPNTLFREFMRVVIRTCLITTPFGDCLRSQVPPKADLRPQLGRSPMVNIPPLHEDNHRTQRRLCASWLRFSICADCGWGNFCQNISPVLSSCLPS